MGSTRQHRAAFALSIALVLLFGTVQAATPLRLEAIASPVDGSRWEIRVIPEDGNHTSSETLLFEGGRVATQGGVWAGFDATPYSLLRSGSAWRFQAEQFRDEETRAHWIGEIQNDTIRGTVTIVPKRGAVLKFAFAGRRARI